MELRVKKPALLLAMGVLVLALAGVGCGDDDTDPAGTGGGGSGGTGGGGTGGGGSGGTGGGTVTIAECAANAADALPTTFPLTEACLTCICTDDVPKTEACTNNAMCWPFVQCAVVNCAGEATCAVDMCTASFAGYTQAVALEPSITGCRDTCFPSANIDGGDTDGGN